MIRVLLADDQQLIREALAALLGLRLLLGLSPGHGSRQGAEEGSRCQCRPPHAPIPRRAARNRGGSVADLLLTKLLSEMATGR